MPRVGRRRKSNLGLPAGVTEKEGTWYWQPTTERERAARRRLRKEAAARGERLTVGCTLGPAGSLEARKKWAEVSGRPVDPKDVDGTVAELLLLWQRDGLKKRPNGKPRAASTIGMYEGCIPVLVDKFGKSVYGKTNFEASRGLAIGTAEIQTFISEHPHPTMANRLFAVLDNAFAHGVRKGKTTYNPCEDVVKNAGGRRSRAPLEWEVECLGALAAPAVRLILEYKGICGWRISKVIGLQRKQLHPDGIRVQPAKGAQAEVWLWSPEARRIVTEAELLPGATKFPASPLFPHSRGKAYTYDGFYSAWTNLLEEANAELAAGGVVDVDTLEDSWPGLAIHDLNIHDLRSKVHDDAEDQGREGHQVLGNTEQVADAHYARREKRRQYLK